MGLWFYIFRNVTVDGHVYFVKQEQRTNTSREGQGRFQLSMFRNTKFEVERLLYFHFLFTLH